VAVANGKWQQFAQSDKLHTGHEKLMAMLVAVRWLCDCAEKMELPRCYRASAATRIKEADIEYSDHNFLSK